MKRKINGIIALVMTALLLATEIGSLPVVWAADDDTEYFVKDDIEEDEDAEDFGRKVYDDISNYEEENEYEKELNGTKCRTIVPIDERVGEAGENTSSDTSNYYSKWEYWSQGASKDSGMRAYGCLITAQAKLLKEAGILEKGWNPDDYLDWLRRKNKINSYFWLGANTIEDYAAEKGVEIIDKGKKERVLSGRNDANDVKKVKEYIDNGYYVILSRDNHHVYVDREYSIITNTPVISDSTHSYSYKGDMCYKFDADAGCGSFYDIRYYKFGVLKNQVETVVIISPYLSNSYIVGKQYQMIGIVTPEDADNKELVWKSDREDILKVNQNGLVTTIAPGTATITATAISGVSGTLTITVGESSSPVAVTGISLSETKLEVTSGDIRKLIATITPDNATNKNIKWTTTDADIAYVAKEGTVTAGLKAGTAIVTAEAADGSGIKAECEVTVSLAEGKSVKATGIALDKTNIVLDEGEKIQLTATISPDDTTIKQVEWISSDEDVLLVDNNGAVTALKEGAATVTVRTTDGSEKSATCKISVFGQGSGFFVSVFADKIRSTCALFNAELSSGLKPEEYGIYISKDADFSIFNKIRISNLTTLSRLKIDLKKLTEGLDENTEYYYRLFMNVEGEEYLSKTEVFKTTKKEDEPEEPEWTPVYKKGDIINYGHWAYGGSNLIPYNDLYKELQNAPSGYNVGSDGKLYWVSSNKDVYGTIPVRWVVLDESAEDILVMSEYVLSGGSYSSNLSAGVVTWENSELRKKINSYGYLRSFFSDGEINDIIADTLDSETSYTADKLTLPSYEELGRYFKNGDMRAHYYVDDKPEITTPITGGGNELAYNTTNYTCAYWTRTSNRTNYGYSQPLYVDSEGDMRCGGRVYYTWNSGIRPIMRIRKSSPYIDNPIDTDSLGFKDAEPLVLNEGKMADIPEVIDCNGITPNQTGNLTNIIVISDRRNVNSTLKLVAGDGKFTEKVYGLTPQVLSYSIELQVMPDKENLSVSKRGNYYALCWYRKDYKGWYQIERSEDETGPFEALVSGYQKDISGFNASNSAGRYNYTYTDSTADPEKEYWYRIKGLYAKTGSNNEDEHVGELNGVSMPYSNIVHVGKSIVLVSEISVSQEQMVMNEGDSRKLTASVMPADATNTMIDWICKDTSVVNLEVLDDGVMVHALRAGTATITAVSGGVSKNINVTVKEYGSGDDIPVTGISLSESDVTIEKGQSAAITATITPAEATDAIIDWESSDPSIATIEASGSSVRINALKAGMTTVTASVGDVSASASVTVTDSSAVQVSGISLSKTNIRILRGGTTELTATVSPKEAAEAALLWHSSDSSIVTVNGNGTKGSLTAVGVGSADITVMAENGVKASCKVTVYEEGTDVYVSPMNPVVPIDETTTEIHLVKGQKFTLAEAGWVSSDKKTLAISKKNLMTAKKVTTAPVQLTNNGRSIDVYITQPKMAAKSITLQAGSTQPIGFNYDSEHLPVQWYCNTPDIATVSEDGEVTGVAKGTATITAFVNGSAYNCKVKVKEDVVAEERTLHMTVSGKKTISIKGLKKVTWVSDDETIVSVAKKNKLTALATGETVLRTEYEGKEYRIRVYVEDPTITTNVIQNSGKNKYKLTLASGASAAIEFASVNQTVIFRSSKGETAYVDTDGTIVANRPGKAKLTAKVNGKTITITVTVQ